MSRVGKKPILIPDKTKVLYKDRIVTVEGQKGVLSRTIHPLINLEIKDGIVNVTTKKDDRVSRSLQGLTRSLVANMVTGVNKGFERVLEING
ncbi:MAG: 50S ribosomal protein L6, partial [Deltaproteobacteria bacterium]|nr:50S ribosomal protein L6 [Deltaproteobacteria bacterium]